MNNIMSLLASVTKGVSVVGVRFKDANGVAMGKVYHYKTTDASVVEGDEVVVNSPFGGLQVVKVQSVQSAGDVIDATNGIDYKWIVQKVDLSDYLAKQEQDHKDQELIAKVQRRVQQQKALREIRDALGADGVDCPELEELLGRLSGE